MINFRENRNCFILHHHNAHVWSPGPGQSYRCDGSPARTAPWDEHPKGHCEKLTNHEPHLFLHESTWHRCDGGGIIPEPKEMYVKEDTPNNAELAHRPEYGDPLQNMIEQNAMFVAYLSGRQPTPFDTTIFQVLIKLHRMGKMPDYKDNYDDVRGYLALAEGLIGKDMIEAETAAQYREKKRLRDFDKAHPEIEDTGAPETYTENIIKPNEYTPFIPVFRGTTIPRLPHVIANDLAVAEEEAEAGLRDPHVD